MFVARSYVGVLQMGDPEDPAALSASLTIMQRIQYTADQICATNKRAGKYAFFCSPSDFTKVQNQQLALGIAPTAIANEYGTQSLSCMTSLGNVEIIALPRKASGSGWLLPMSGDDQLELDVAGGSKGIGGHVETAYNTASTGEAQWETTLATLATLTIGSPMVFGLVSTV